MTKVLMVAARNLYEPNGEWRLIASRAQSLSAAYGVDTDAIVLLPKRRMESQNPAPVVAGLNILSYIPFSSLFLIPISAAKLAMSVRRNMRREHYAAVILSGGPAYLIAPFISSDKLIVDVHGVLEELVEYSPRRPLVKMARRALWAMLSALERMAIERSAGVLAVTRELSAHLALQHAVSQSFVVPCVGNHLGVLDPVESRHRWREKLGLQAEDVAFVYAGGLVAWQLIRESVQFFLLYRKTSTRGAKLILFTPNYREAMTIAVEAGVDLNDLVSITLQASDVVEALHACDVGLVLRDDTLTNRVAFPNKFAEYMAAGLVIVSSPGLREPASIILEHDLGLVIRPDKLMEQSREHQQALEESLRRRSADWFAYHQRCSKVLESQISMEKALLPLAAFVKGN